MRWPFVLLWLFSSATGAAIDAYQFPNEDLRARHHQLIDELRCPQCLNTNIAGSDAMIAKDLRREVHRLLLEGKTDEEILTFMQQRYGDFILYNPRVTAGTVVLWFGPLLLLVVAGAILVTVIRRRRRAEVLEVDTDRLDALLNRRGEG